MAALREIEEAVPMIFSSLPAVPEALRHVIATALPPDPKSRRLPPVLSMSLTKQRHQGLSGADDLRPALMIA